LLFAIIKVDLKFSIKGRIAPDAIQPGPHFHPPIIGRIYSLVPVFLLPALNCHVLDSILLQWKMELG